MEFDIPQMISSIGIPGALCFYVLTTQRKTMEALKDAVNANTRMISVFAAKIGVSVQEEVDTNAKL